ncbi:hypothetical protein C2845_PM08G14280 [Panicum miliaceum]|uniref:Uncharacterized protein n=1 Tax=Panicum miliaceum TaxID=4540 RepID=A0A3L6R4V0_PANMI|nr:hypothetical protein C2845_PM08G14280 [Panicum miliaceum]
MAIGHRWISSYGWGKPPSPPTKAPIRPKRRLVPLGRLEMGTGRSSSPLFEVAWEFSRQQIDCSLPSSAKGALREEGKLKERVVKGLDGMRLFDTILSRRVIPLAKRMSKMWEYSDHTDPDWVSPEAVSDDEVWLWLEMVLKVGNQRIVGGPPGLR